MLTAKIGRWLTGPKAAQAGEGSAGPGPRCGLGAARAAREAGSWAGFARWAEWFAFGPVYTVQLERAAVRGAGRAPCWQRCELGLRAEMALFYSLFFKSIFE
jgi:hypothetical protein